MLNRIIFFLGFVIVYSVFIAGEVNADNYNFSVETLEGRVESVLAETEIEIGSETKRSQVLRIFVTKGSLKGSYLEVEHDTLLEGEYRKLNAGDGVILTYTSDFEGRESFYITDRIRRGGLIWLFILFVFAALTVGKRWGLASLVGMSFSFFIIFKLILPSIISGKDPILSAIFGSSIIIPVTFSLSHGFNRKTLIAGISTVITLFVIGFLAVVYSDLTFLTGFSAEEALFLQYEIGHSLNMKGVLLAGIIIASLGILDDITISQASIVNELSLANKSYKFIKLFEKGMNVGRDHIASLINTLVLVYTGASLPLMLLFVNNPRPFSEIINYEFIAEEIVRTLVGSIGLILAVPITTTLAAFYFQKRAKLN
jgi:uncharacterized membrane protein